MKILRPARLPTDVQSTASLCAVPSGFVSPLMLFSALLAARGMAVPLTFKVTVQVEPAAHPVVPVGPSLVSKLNPAVCVSTRDWPARTFVPAPPAHIGAAQQAIHHVNALRPCVSVTVTLVITTASLRTGTASNETPKNNNATDIRPKILVLIAASPLLSKCRSSWSSTCQCPVHQSLMGVARSNTHASSRIAVKSALCQTSRWWSLLKCKVWRQLMTAGITEPGRALLKSK